MRFTGWPPEALTWFRELEADNSRTWFHAHKKVYEQAVRQPLEALLEEVAPEFGEARVFRPNRDTRFSADKSPYKTAAAASIPGGFYVQVSAEGLMAGAGMYHLEREQLARFREAIDDDRTGKELVKIVTVAEKAGLDVASHEQLATAPRGYAKDHPRIELLRHKGLVVAKHSPPRKWLHTAAAKDHVVEVWRGARPLLAWLDKNVGPAESWGE